MANQPSVPIKKPDGSIVKLSMPEFLEYKKTGKLPEQNVNVEEVETPEKLESLIAVQVKPEIISNENAPENSSLETQENLESLDNVEPKYDFFAEDHEKSSEDDLGASDMADDKKSEMPDDLVIASPVALSTTAPVTNIFVDEAKAATVNWTKDDHKSPIEEDITKDDVVDLENIKKIPDTRDEMVDPVLEKANITLDQNLQSRLRSLIISRIKEIRNDDKVKTYAMQSTDQGGLGLNAEQAESLLLAIRSEMHLQPLSDGLNNLVKKPQLAKPTLVKQQKTRSYTPSPTKLVGNKKPILHDIRPATGSAEIPYRQVGKGFETMGPIDEMAKFSQIDLERLGSEKLRVIDIMKNKFEVLKEESILLYLDAVKAWLHSPLFIQYQDVIVQSLNNKKTVNQIIQEGGTSLSMKDIDIIVEINKIAR